MVEPKIALVIGTIALVTGFGWMLILGTDVIGLSDICGRAGLVASGFSGLWLRWQVMIGTMMLPCLAPTIIAVARAERQRYGVLTAAMAFSLSYASIVSLASGVAALFDPIASGLALPATLGCLVVALGLFRLPYPQWLRAGTDPVRNGVRKGIADLPTITAMILVQFAFGSHNVPAMILMGLAMLIGTTPRHCRQHFTPHNWRGPW